MTGMLYSTEYKSSKGGCEPLLKNNRNIAKMNSGTVYFISLAFLVIKTDAIAAIGTLNVTINHVVESINGSALIQGHHVPISLKTFANDVVLLNISRVWFVSMYVGVGVESSMIVIMVK
jgi:hypothetical protein